MRDDHEFLERRIVTGLIVSRDYWHRIQRVWDTSLMESPELRMVAGWCVEHLEKYDKAPDKDIEAIYMGCLQGGELSKAEAQYVEELLVSLSDEYGRGVQFNAAYLRDQTIGYFKAQELERHSREVKALIDANRVQEADILARSYSPTVREDSDVGIDLASEEALERVERAFSETGQNVVTYPGALGEMWNEHLIRGGFFTLLAPEKRGKTWMLLEIALRAIRGKANVAFFEAGDMTESQLLRRICVYICQRSDKERYCQERSRPVGDCVYNQLDLCTRSDRNCDHGVFPGVGEESFRKEPQQFASYDVLRQKREDNPDYEPCDSHGCGSRWGAVWLRRIPASRVLIASQAKKALRMFFRRYRRRFRLITYPAGLLTVSEMRRCLNDWERHDGFVPDVIAVDYADLLSADDGAVTEFRHRQDHIWKSLRALSQERHALVLTATQANAESYTRSRLSISNFSEDKRKLAHVTAQYGLNQDPQGREKRLGILRVNEIVIREGAFSPDHEVCVLQDLAAGRPYLESFVLRRGPQ